MDSASPIATRTAGQPTVDSGNATLANGARKFSTAEFTFALDWLSVRSWRAGCRDAGHRSATGEAAA